MRGRGEPEWSVAARWAALAAAARQRETTGTWLAAAAGEVRRNAARGMRAVPYALQRVDQVWEDNQGWAQQIPEPPST